MALALRRARRRGPAGAAPAGPAPGPGDQRSRSPVSSLRLAPGGVPGVSPGLRRGRPAAATVASRLWRCRRTASRPEDQRRRRSRGSDRVLVEGPRPAGPGPPGCGGGTGPHGRRRVGGPAAAARTRTALAEAPPASGTGVLGPPAGKPRRRPVTLPWRCRVSLTACSRTQRRISRPGSAATGVSSTHQPASSAASRVGVRRRRRGSGPCRPPWRRAARTTGGLVRQLLDATPTAAAAARAQASAGSVDAGPPAQRHRAQRPVPEGVGLRRSIPSDPRDSCMVLPGPSGRPRRSRRHRRPRPGCRPACRGWPHSWGRRPWHPGPTTERFHPPNGWRRTMAPVVPRLT